MAASAYSVGGRRLMCLKKTRAHRRLSQHNVAWVVDYLRFTISGNSRAARGFYWDTCAYTAELKIDVKSKILGFFLISA